MRARPLFIETGRLTRVATGSAIRIGLVYRIGGRRFALPAQVRVRRLGPPRRYIQELPRTNQRFTRRAASSSVATSSRLPDAARSGRSAVRLGREREPQRGRNHVLLECGVSADVLDRAPLIDDHLD